MKTFGRLAFTTILSVTVKITMSICGIFAKIPSDGTTMNYTPKNKGMGYVRRVCNTEAKLAIKQIYRINKTPTDFENLSALIICLLRSKFTLCDFSDKSITLLTQPLFFLGYFFRLLKIKLLNRMIFITMKNTVTAMSVKTGFVGARVARNIKGKPNTIAGKF